MSAEILRAMVANYSRNNLWDHLDAKACADAADEIEALRAENEALKQQVEQGKRDAVPEDIRKDAERYRWLRGEHNGVSVVMPCPPDDAYVPHTGCLDRAIDAAIAAAPKQEK